MVTSPIDSKVRRRKPSGEVSQYATSHRRIGPVLIRRLAVLVAVVLVAPGIDEQCGARRSWLRKKQRCLSVKVRQVDIGAVFDELIDEAVVVPTRGGHQRRLANRRRSIERKTELNELKGTLGLDTRRAYGRQYVRIV